MDDGSTLLLIKNGVLIVAALASIAVSARGARGAWLCIAAIVVPAALGIGALFLPELLGTEITDRVRMTVAGVVLLSGLSVFLLRLRKAPPVITASGTDLVEVTRQLLASATIFAVLLLGLFALMSAARS